VVGVPLIAPLLELMDRPGGVVPLQLQVYGVVPPLAVQVAEE
jgi:hypothetical protein